MGLHICLLDDDGNDVEGWDYIRQGNDRSFPALIDFDNIIHQEELSDSSGFRPTDIDRIKRDLYKEGWYDCERYINLLNLMESGKYWLFFSR
jgi:hypothetical protein